MNGLDLLELLANELPGVVIAQARQSYPAKNPDEVSAPGLSLARIRDLDGYAYICERRRQMLSREQMHDWYDEKLALVDQARKAGEEALVWGGIFHRNGFRHEVLVDLRARRVIFREIGPTGSTD